MEVNTSVSPSLHPGVISALAGDEDTADSVADVRGAFETAYAGLTAVHAARQAARENPTLTEAAAILLVADYADKTQKKITMRLDAAHARLKAAITEGERQLSQPLEGAAAGGFTAEIRAYVKGLKHEDRTAFMNEAVRVGDTKTLAAVIGAPSYLSGLSTAERDVFTRSHHERVNPTLAKRLAVMKAAQSLIHERGGLVFDEIDKAIDAKPARVASLRAARDKATAAYTFTP